MKQINRTDETFLITSGY